MSIFSIRLKQQREGCKLTQKQMADKLNIPYNTYLKYEQKKLNRQPDYETLRKITVILGVSADYLLGIID